MKTIKRMLLIGAVVLALLSVTGCVVISCDEPSHPKHRHLATPDDGATAEETCVARL